MTIRIVLPWRTEEDAQLRELHENGESIQGIACALGRSRGSVRGRITVLGIARKRCWTAQEENELRDMYQQAGPDGVLNLGDLAARMGRDKSNVCRKARQLGLSTSFTRKKVERRKDRRKFKGDEAARHQHASERMRSWIQENGHPRGALGKKHSASSRQKIAESIHARWGAMSPAEREAFVTKAARRARAAGVTAPRVRRGSWKAGWRIVGGQRNYYRSRWEANYARYLEWLRGRGEIHAWEHEARVFWFEAIRRGVRSYLPDFMVTRNDGAIEWHEVKGWMDDRSRTTLKRFTKYYPSERLVLVRERTYRDIKNKLSSLILEWEF